MTASMLIRAIAANPRASLQDALLLFCLMIVALLLALQYDLFYFIQELSAEERQLSLAEAIFLTTLLGASIFMFIVRRLHDLKRDIALKASAETEVRELTALAMQDPLTGLLNRRALLSALGAATKSKGAQHALFLIDLDGFKRVNDHYGHSVGDEVLEVIASRFQAASRPSDIVSRLGGDEFAVLSYDVDRETAHEIGMRLLETLNSKIQAGGHAHKVGMSIGVALIPDDGVTAEGVLHHADIAMYRAKERQNSLMFFEPVMSQKRQIA
ncbi:MAG: diguanylate cyclase domain-containing protein [Methyloceanibacter sp.]|uniref:diguanylate cyclase domain-containing protein n=1 Tax=Methyloceanibacter sp. TaxID=1965321 RepID=UPI003D6D336D